MEWKLTDSRPIWQQLTEQITLRILKGEYPPGGRLPAVRDLAVQAGVNPNTMQRAMAQLEQDGLAVGSRTAGRTVTEDTAVIQAARRKRAGRPWRNACRFWPIWDTPGRRPWRY